MQCQSGFVPHLCRLCSIWALKKTTLTGCHISNMFSQLFHQTPASGGGYWQAPTNSWIIPAFPLICWTSSPSFKESVTLQLSSVEWEKYLHAAAENLVCTGTSVNLLSLSTITEAQSQCPFWSHHWGDKLFFSTPKCTCEVASRLCMSSLSIPRQRECYNRDRR